MGMKIVDAHRVISRECTDFEAKRIAREAFLMKDFFGEYTVALAHPQVDDREPLRFFVLRHFLLDEARSTVIVNPRITRHSGYTVDSLEGCHTWPGRPHKVVQRWRKCEVQYQVLDGNKLSEIREEALVGFKAFVFQHELDHLDGKYCYD